MAELVRSGSYDVSISESPLGAEALLGRLQEVGSLYRAARTAFPWYETDLSVDEACDYIASVTQREGFGAFIAESSEGGQAVGARLHTLTTLDRLASERGLSLREFVQVLTAPNDETPLIWTQETFVSPDYQRQGIASRLGRTALAYLAHQYSNGVVLCRVRSDNIASIAGIRRVGYERSGVCQPHPTLQGLKYEYWYMRL